MLSILVYLLSQFLSSRDNSFSVIVDLSISPCNYVKFCFVNVETPRLCALRFRIPLSYW